MTTDTQTSTDVEITSNYPDHLINIEVYEEGDQYVATGDKEDCARGIAETVAGAVEAYAEAVRTEQEAVTHE